ncbi:MAG: MG2 domain-containing protein [Thermodesulfobacteriota bacterium]|nr:MG2 domain-containing protein [Thermodesulfobacteriota bacterium]
MRYKKHTKKYRSDNQSYKIEIPEVEDIAFPVPLGIRDILKGEAGAVYGRVSTRPPVIKDEREYNFFAQITPFQVHVKIGHFNTLIWVTDLSFGEPVADARVSIYKDSISSLSKTKSIEAKTDKQGIAVFPGTEQLDPKLETFKWCYRNRDECTRLFVRVVKDKDIALLPLEYRFLIDTYRVSRYTVGSSQKKRYGHIRAWGTTAQGVYRAGDTIEYKLYVRNQNNERFTKPPRSGYRLKIIDPTGKTVHELKDIGLSEFGAYSGDFTVQNNGAVGWYCFQLSADFTKFTWQPIRVLVSDFTPFPFVLKMRSMVTYFIRKTK